MTSLPYADRPAIPTGFKDRRTGLKVMGVLQIIAGALCGCMALTTPLALLVPRRPGMPPPPTVASIAGALLMYIAIAVFFIWTGIGALRTQRWVRPIMLVAAWGWLAMGVFSSIFILLEGPRLARAFSAAQPPGSPGMTSAVITTIMVLTVVMMGLIYLVAPTILIWFYQRRDVAATANYFDSKPRWTDRCPIPVLGMSLWLLLAAFSVLFAAPFKVIPMFGTLLTGLKASLVCFVLAAFLAVLASRIYRLRIWAWWATLGLVFIGGLSNAITFSKIDLTDLYRAGGYPPEQIQMMQRIGLPDRITIMVCTLVAMAAAVVYLLFVRRFFTAPAANLAFSGEAPASVLPLPAGTAHPPR